jgi:hypothetical protein
MNTRLRMPIVLLGCCCVSPCALAADKLDVKPGLWEITSTHQISGIPPMPKEWQDKVTPEQRAAMEAAFKKEAEKGPQTDTDRECITQQEAEQPFDLGDAKDCKQTVVRTTRTTQDADAGNDDRIARSATRRQQGCDEGQVAAAGSLARAGLRRRGRCGR